MAICSTFFLADDFKRLGSAGGTSSNLVMMATSGISSVEDRTDKMTPPDVAFSPWLKTNGQNLIWTQKRRRHEARAMPQGPERTAAMKKAGILRKAADAHGIIYAKRGRPTKT